MDNEQIARVAHQVNRAYCLSLGDTSQLSWEEAPQWQQDSAINGVKFHRDNPLAGVRDSHASWLKEKDEAGWKYGLIKDETKKEHPCIVDYFDLPIEQRAKDYLFREIVHSLIYGE